MDNNEIMVNEEVIEATEEMIAVGSGKGIKIAVGISLALIGSVVAYKYVVKPMMIKIKAKNEWWQNIDEEVEDLEIVEMKEESEEIQ